MTQQGPLWHRQLLLTVLTAVLGAATMAVGAGCTSDDAAAGPTVVQPGAPGTPGRVLTDGPPAMVGPAHTAADVWFVHAMIAHHTQALELTALVPDRSDREDIGLLARRIEVTQADEIALLEDWLATRGATDGATDHSGHGAGQPDGMLTEHQLASLAAASGPAFDRLFLELMIIHHEGALVMIDELLAAGGGQEAALFRLMTGIGADQRMEIDRMADLLMDL